MEDQGETGEPSKTRRHEDLLANYVAQMGEPSLGMLDKVSVMFGAV